MQIAQQITYINETNLPLIDTGVNVFIQQKLFFIFIPDNVILAFYMISVIIWKIYLSTF